MPFFIEVDHRISQFLCKEFPYVLGVSDRAESDHALRSRHSQCCLPSISTASALRTTKSRLTRLNTRPACTPVNASDMPLPTYPHDSGPVWFARPSLYGSCIRYSLPVLTGASERKPTSSRFATGAVSSAASPMAIRPWCWPRLASDISQEPVGARDDT